MFRIAIANAYRAPVLAGVPRSLAGKSAGYAFARRLYSDKPGPATEQQEPSEKASATAEPAVVSVEEFEKLKKASAEKDAKLKELKDAYLRSLADAENIRTRSKTEVDNTKVFAIQKFAKDLLDTVDILELALHHVPREHLADKVANKHLVDLFEGVDMTKSSLLRTLERHGVESFDPLDKPYDPNMSHALYQAPIPGKTPGTVFSVEKRGYILKGRVLRPAQVGVVLDPTGN
ncbi:GrpE, mitochondrial [Coemansia thaxteri]|uniref:GrpE protein homolog, mitochondrial n=1 Tax=Coemansia thaxteri TaxID=2663907 RepID=A0A9W8BD10_9FUNG|nr:GrpE, mitochondrial [Coemansia thaxteri]KAJ2008901.1 GrpE, mitochondrial [Coemansia thaxteri]KAJ2473761.1 GrpE, mitochondrial [Coemansia sp. RSA 2322]KAJ2487247.1 GrpE, mitochondrial [Coemansia sp. RSA 2320]